MLLVGMFLPAYAVKVVFRLDDLRLGESDDTTHIKVLNMFMTKHVPLSMAVIPCVDASEKPCEGDLLGYSASIFDANQVEIAMHGLTHSSIGHHGEFGTLDQTETIRRIDKGKDILHNKTGYPIRTFIPPFNAVNKYLGTALLNDSIHIISADMFNNYYTSGIQYYPETLGHLMEKYGIWKAARNVIEQCKDKKAICVVMFHAYDLPNQEAFDQLEELLDYCTKAENVELYTFSGLYQSGEHSDWRRYKVNQYSSGLQKCLLPVGVLYPTWKCLLVHCLNALLYALFAALGLLLYPFVKRQRVRIILIIFSILCASFAFYAAWQHSMGPVTLFFLLGICNLLQVLCVVLLRKRNK